MKKAKVRIVGDPELAKELKDLIIEKFEADFRFYNRAPTRYGIPAEGLVSYYIAVKRRRT